MLPQAPIGKLSDLNTNTNVFRFKTLRWRRQESGGSELSNGQNVVGGSSSLCGAAQAADTMPPSSAARRRRVDDDASAALPACKVKTVWLWRGVASRLQLAFTALLASAACT